MQTDLYDSGYGLGLSFRTKIILTAAIVCFVALFVFLLQHYNPHRNKSVQQESTIDQTNTVSIIRGMMEKQEKQEKPAEPVTIRSEVTRPIIIRQSIYRPTINPEFVQSGGQSAISVFANETTLNTQPSESRALQSEQLENTHIKDELHIARKYEILAGTLIPATLVTAIHSQLPGKIIAKVSQNVYDTATGNYLMIPQGTTLLGDYDAHIPYGQERVMLSWSRIVFPNGNSISLEGQPGVDESGQSGLHDKVNNHFIKTFGHSALISLIGAAGQLSQPKVDKNTLSNQQVIYGAMGRELSERGAQMMSKDLNVQPTIEIRQGTHFDVLLTRDLSLPFPYQFGGS